MKNRQSHRRWAFLAGAVVILGGAIAIGLGLHWRGARLPAVSTEVVARRDVAVTIEAAGVVEPIDLVEVKSKASGQILRMPVQVGSVLRVGDLLAQIDTVDVQNQYEQAFAAERAARAKVDVSKAGLQRAEALYDQKIITVVEHESATLDYANAEAQLVKARTDLDSARQRRDDATVRAPVAGTVLEQPVVAGQVIVSATSSVSGGTVLLRVADLSRIRLRTLVAETDIGSVRPGQTAVVSVEAFPQQTFEGTVEKIEPQAVVQQSVTMFPVLVSISNENGLLLPGMNGEVSIQVDRRDNVLTVPLDAVRSVRELPAAAEALGVPPDSIRAQITRGFGARGGARPPGPGGRADSSGTRAWDRRGHRVGADPGAAGADRGGRGQAVLVKTAHGLEARMVRLGLSDFDYAQVLAGVSEGDEVVLMSVAEQQAKRSADQSQLRARLGNGLPGGGGSPPSRGGR